MPQGSSDATVYVGMAADGIHHGHIRLLKAASAYGRVIVGLLTDEAISSYKAPPLQTYVDRREVLLSIGNVSDVIAQDTHDYRKNLAALHPDYVVHGDDWAGGAQAKVREQVIGWLRAHGGELIEPRYTPGVSSSQLRNKISVDVVASQPTNGLMSALDKVDFLRVVEVHSGISAAIVQHTRDYGPSGEVKSFDAVWMSSLVDSTLRAKLDNESVDLTSRLALLDDIQNASSLPIIFDGDTGGKTEHFISNFKTLGRRGIDAVIIEDKVGLKQNSLYGLERPQMLDDPRAFAEKIRAGKDIQIRDEGPLIIARIESLIAGENLSDALSRAEIYLEAGADGIMIHSRERSPAEVFSFAEEYVKWRTMKPLVAVPSSYSHVTADELASKGFNIIIYANHLIRASIPAMENAAKRILMDGRSSDLEGDLMTIKEILEYVSDE